MKTVNKQFILKKKHFNNYQIIYLILANKFAPLNEYNQFFPIEPNWNINKPVFRNYGTNLNWTIIVRFQLISKISDRFSYSHLARWSQTTQLDQMRIGKFLGGGNIAWNFQFSYFGNSDFHVAFSEHNPFSSKAILIPDKITQHWLCKG